MFRLDGKTIAVIGAGSGIGRAGRHRGGGTRRLRGVPRCECRRARRSPPPRSPARAARRDAGACDVTSVTSVRDALVGAAGKFDRLDGVVCTPAINVRKPILKYTGDEFDRVVGVNLKGSFHVLQAAGQLMTLQGFGSIVMFSSIRSIVTEPGQSVYSMTKSGIVQLVRTAATEWGEKGVRVNAIGPGVIETPLTAPIKAQADWYNAYAQKTPDEAMGQGRGNGGPDRVSTL
jgi:NAD(P)-dependent dehydrogenase (short-subunit alcohol dehydrogenase family)